MTRTREHFIGWNTAFNYKYRYGQGPPCSVLSPATVSNHRFPATYVPEYVPYIARKLENEAQS